MRVLAVGCALVLAACAVEEGHPPVARIAASPRAIPEHDGFQTDVLLDGSASADPFDDPDGTIPLAFAWDVRGDEFRVEAGTPEQAMMTVRLLGDRPATIRLTVTDRDGRTGIAEEQLQLTIP